MDFYDKVPDKYLRFGDVIRGYVTADVSIKEPILQLSAELPPYNLEISIPSLCVVLTPCCSIEDGTMAISPLIRLRSDFMKNSYFEEDFTRINRQMLPEQTLSNSEWDTLEAKRKDELISVGKNFALFQFFIFPLAGYSKPYALRGKEIDYYMIDFKNIYKVKCSLIKRTDLIKATDNLDPLINSKVLQLAQEARSELRKKLAYFYNRKPKEDTSVD